MLATLSDEVVEGDEWIYERKLDGVRCLVFRDDNGVRLMSRNRKDRTDTYPEIAEALAHCELPNLIADGEIVAFEGNVTSFERLQGRMQLKDADEARATGIAVYCYLFDILFLDGYRLTRCALEDRKRVLRKVIQWEDPIRYTQHFNADGARHLRKACEKGWEGLIAKKRSSRYVHSRGKAWLKLKCSSRQEFVICGFTDPHGEREGFGALLLGYYDGGELVYAGKVGTGFDDQTLRSLHSKLNGLERKTAPCRDEQELPGDVHWVTPKLVGEVAFTEWTKKGRLRHPRFKGLRQDKSAEDVHRERGKSSV